MLLRFFNIFLATLVLIGSIGLPVNRHFCMGELKSVAIFGVAEKCHKDQTQKQCPFHQGQQEQETGKKKGCCDDEHELVQIDDQEPTGNTALPSIIAVLGDFPPLLFSYLAPHPRPRKNSNFQYYRPPPIIPDPVLEFQVFRI